ncbi:E3 ubiquitin-protein ligase RNF216-like [Mytilus edulis]|uniref:E3 ubiquitin-protein ligase RNF216-like n=1 Tax=Mytilus edulis TaxID=6550 RepID=UPI0039EEBB1C
MERTEDGISKCKQRRLSDNGFTSSHEMIEDLESLEGTEEYNADSIFSQETQAYSQDVGGLDEVQAYNETDGDESVPKMTKLKSVMVDANFIADILSDVDVSEIYDKLKDIRSNENRIEVVTNQLLERRSKVKAPAKPSMTGANLMKDFVKIIDSATKNMPALPVSAEDIEELLVASQNRKDRVDHVFSQILNLHFLKRKGNGDVIKDMKIVIVRCPGIPFEEISKMMLQKKTHTDRTQQVLDYFVPKRTDLQKSDSVVSVSALANDLLYKDTRIIAKVMPDIDRNEIYAYLEAHHDEKNRIQVVIEELMKMKQGGESLASLDVTTDGLITSPKPSKGIFNIQDEVDELRQIFPDCDPNYLYDELEKKADDKERMKTVAMAMFEDKKYPKLKEREEQENKISTRNRIKNLKFDMEEFMQKFPEPVKFFEDDNRKMNENYSKHVDIQIRNDFPQLKGKYIKKILDKHNHHYTTTRKDIQADVADAQLRNQRKKMKSKPRTKTVNLPEDPDEFFYYEILYCEHEPLIKDHLEEKERFLQLQRKQAKENGELFECGCCFDDECMFEEMSVCAEGHLFCKECIRRSSEVIIGDGKTKFPCLLDSCTEEFPVSVLQQILPTNMFSILLRRLQEEEIKQAGIPDLVSCPFCSFATIMSDEDKVFKCMNPECLKESCRLCKEPNHVPYRCDEVEKQGETNMRTFIENMLTEAMLRTCHECGKRFMKEVGCNMMTCVCGAHMCYVCREPGIGYDHFSGDNCNEDSMKKLHLKEMKEAAVAAKEKYLHDHPECAEIDLKFDPIKLVEEFAAAQEEDEDEEYDEDDDDDDDMDDYER